MQAHWRLASRAAEEAGVELRALETLEDADRILAVMTATWGGQEVTREIFRALAESGNPPYGAVDGDELVGYVCGWLGTGPDGFHVHSHMLAVLEPWRARGVGYALKLAQRAQAIDAGVRLVRWTFDPLIARNAHFNLRKLGVVADRFERNFYGEMTDALNRGDRSDRLVARWEVDREPGPRAVPRLPERPLVAAAGPPDAPRPQPATERPDADHAWSVAVPWDHAALRGSDPGLARAWRDAVGDALETAIGAGLVPGAFVTNRGERTARYVLASTEAVDAVRGETR